MTPVYSLPEGRSRRVNVHGSRSAGRVRLQAAALALLGTLPLPAASQVPISPGRGDVSLEGPPPPAAPEVVNRDAEGRATLRAVRLTAPLVIDGVLDEDFYRDTPAVSDFVQSLPEEGATPTERTEAWVGFDDANVYVSARVWDSAPEAAWVANEMRRDSPSLELNDQFGVFLDTYYDRRNGVGFFVNPLGGFTDLQIMNEQDANTDWNPVAEIRTGRFDGGWSVEMAIPFRSLRYQSGRDQVWGIQMRRSVVRRNEWNHLTFLPFAVVGNGTRGAMRVSRYGTLVGIEPPPPSRNLEVKPYAISGIRTDRGAERELSSDTHADAGLDVKYGVTENLTADLTLNTDFAQVEVDEQQANLTRFNLFFPEKREFFLESQGIFEFGNGGRGEGTTGGGGPPGSSSVSSSGRGRGARSVHAPTLFYSRRIGLQDGAPVPILGGGRVTGKIGSFDVGAVGIRTGAENSVGADPTAFTVLRLRRDLLARSSIGVLFEDRSTSLTSGTGRNRAYGADANFAFLENLQIFGYYARTETDGLRGKTTATELGSGGAGPVERLGRPHRGRRGLQPRDRVSEKAGIPGDEPLRAGEPEAHLRPLDSPHYPGWPRHISRERAIRLRRDPPTRRSDRGGVRERRLADDQCHGRLRTAERRDAHLRRGDPGGFIPLPGR